jgi:biopolymer transport protein ExbB/TolQ
MSKTTIEFIADAGRWITIITLFSFSVVNIAVIIERIVFYRNNAYRNAGDLVLKVRDYVIDSKFDAAIEACGNSRMSIISVIREGINAIKKRCVHTIEILPLELSLDNAIALERIRIEKYIWALGTIGAIGPLVGLFGTVLGIMRSFAEIAMRGNSGLGVVEVAAGGIWESLYTTAFGILVAVPALIAYNYFVKRSRNEFDLLDNAANDIIAIASEYNERNKK